MAARGVDEPVDAPRLRRVPAGLPGGIGFDLSVGDCLHEAETEERLRLARRHDVGERRDRLRTVRADRVRLEQRPARQLDVAPVESGRARLVERAAPADGGRRVAGHARVGVEDRTETLGRVVGLFERVLSVAEELALLHAEPLEGLAELALRVEASRGGSPAEQGEGAGDKRKEQEEGAIPAAHRISFSRACRPLARARYRPGNRDPMTSVTTRRRSHRRFGQRGVGDVRHSPYVACDFLRSSKECPPRIT